MKINTKQLRTRILDLYKTDRRVAEDDKYLITRIWLEDGWDYSQGLYTNLMNVTSPESIRRTRARLVQEGLMEVSDATTEARYREYKQVRANI